MEVHICEFFLWPFLTKWLTVGELELERLFELSILGKAVFYDLPSAHRSKWTLWALTTFTLKRVTSFTFPLWLSTRLCWVFCSLLFCHWLLFPFTRSIAYLLIFSNGNRRVLCTLCFSETLGLSSNSKLFRRGVMLPLFPYCWDLLFSLRLASLIDSFVFLCTFSSIVAEVLSTK